MAPLRFIEPLRGPCHIQIRSDLRRIPGWGGRIRTSTWRNQNPLPYRSSCSGTGRCIRHRNSSLWRPRRLDHNARRDAPLSFAQFEREGIDERIRDKNDVQHHFANGPTAGLKSPIGLRSTKAGHFLLSQGFGGFGPANERERPASISCLRS